MSIVGQKSGQSMADINMTPMIDVLLVLLVIFILIQPLLQLSLDVQLPVEKESESTVPPPPPIVLEILRDGSFLLNTQPVPKDGLPARLDQVYSDRPDKVLFVTADGAVQYQYVVNALDIAKGAGVEVLGAVLPEGAEAASAAAGAGG